VSLPQQFQNKAQVLPVTGEVQRAATTFCRAIPSPMMQKPTLWTR